MMERIVEDLGEKGSGREWCAGVKRRLREGKRYLKKDLQGPLQRGALPM